MRKFLILILVLGGISPIKAQTQFEQCKSKYPDKQAVMLVKKEVVKIMLDKNDSLRVSLEYYSEMIHLGDRTEEYAESNVSFSDFIQLENLEAKTLIPFKKSFKTVRVTEFSEKSQSSSGIFFDDNRSKTFNYPGVQPGAKTILSYTQKFKDPHLLVPYYFNFYVPVLESEVKYFQVLSDIPSL